jgi:hypothetical protein
MKIGVEKKGGTAPISIPIIIRKPKPVEPIPAPSIFIKKKKKEDATKKGGS